MSKSKLILSTNFLTDKANLVEKDFRDNASEVKEWKYQPENMTKILQDGRLEYLPFIIFNRVDFIGKVLEVGAGMCWFSSEVSKLKSVNEVFSLEYSQYMLKEIAPQFMALLSAEEEKITRIQGDFNAMPFEDSFFDTVIVDASLHHATDLSHLLKEINRVIKPNGRLIAIREPIIPLLRPWTRYTFGKEDRKRGITENIYTFKEWKDSFKNAGFNLRFMEFIPKNISKRGIIRLLIPFNKLILGHYIFIAKKV